MGVEARGLGSGSSPCGRQSQEVPVQSRLPSSSLVLIYLEEALGTGTQGYMQSSFTRAMGDRAWLSQLPLAVSGRLTTLASMEPASALMPAPSIS